MASLVADTWDAALLSGLAMLPILYIAHRLDRQIFGLHSLYVWRWGLLLFAYSLNPLGYYSLRPRTWYVVLAAMLAWLAGASAVRHRPVRLPRFLPAKVGASLTSQFSRGRYLVGYGALFGLGLAVFSVYAVDVSRDYGLTALMAAPQQLRIDIAHGRVPLGFHYLYIFEIIPGLALFAAHRFALERSVKYWLATTSGVALVALLGTTARTNVLKALLFAAFVGVAVAKRPLLPGTFLRRALPLVVLSVSIFLVMGGALGKNSAANLLRTSDLEPSPKLGTLLLVYHYNAAQLPTLDALLHDPHVRHTYGAFLVRPIAQVVSRVIPEYSPPSHIGKFYFVPYPFNVATQLDVMYKDFGIPGILVLSALFGALTGGIQSLWHRYRSDAFVALLYAWWAMLVLASTTAAAYIKMNYWVQLVLLWGLCRWSASRGVGAGRRLHVGGR